MFWSNLCAVLQTAPLTFVLHIDELLSMTKAAAL
jgi:hypothetical protein